MSFQLRFINPGKNQTNNSFCDAPEFVTWSRRAVTGTVEISILANDFAVSVVVITSEWNNNIYLHTLTNFHCVLT